MTIKAVTYYQVVCDHDGCGTTTADLGGDFSAWGDHGDAVTDWENGDNVSVTTPDGERHYCVDHAPPSCAECGKTGDLIERNGTGGDLWCAEHVPCEKHENLRQIGKLWFCEKCGEPVPDPFGGAS